MAIDVTHAIVAIIVPATTILTNICHILDDEIYMMIDDDV